MIGRQLLGGVAALAVVGGAVWYVTRAPAGNAAPAEGLQVAVTATVEGGGSWVPYVITVKNLADGTFDGQVLLLEQAPARPSPGIPSPLPVNQPPPAPTSATVAERTAYEASLVVPSRTTRSVTLVAPQGYTTVQAVMGGQVLDQEEVQAQPALPVAVVTQNATAADAVDALSFGDDQTWVTEYTTPAALPTSPLFWSGYLTVVLDDFPTAALRPDQRQALRQFVALGGSLLLVGGPDWRRTLQTLPSDLLPLRSRGSGELSLLPITRLAGQGAPRAVPGLLGSLAPGARPVLTEDDGTPLAAELDFGSGRVVELAVDPGGPELRGTGLGSLAWDEALARTFVTLPGNPPTTGALLGPQPAFTALLPASPEAPLPAPWLVGLVILVYLALVGPGSYLLFFRRLRRPALAWAGIPALALAFTGALYLAGGVFQGGPQDAELQILKPGASDTVNLLTYHRVLFLGRGQDEIMSGRTALAAPLTLDTYRTTGTTCERCVNQLGSLPSGSELVLPKDQPAIRESGVIYGAVRVVGLSATAQSDRGLSVDLADRGGRIVGQVGDAGPAAVAYLTLFSTDGQSLHEAALAALVPPGQEVTVDAPLAGAPAPSTAVQALLRDVAVSALATAGRPVLVGLTQPLPSPIEVDGRAPAQTAVAVLEQPVSVAAGTGARDFEQRLLAVSTGSGQTGFTDVYDVVVPGAGGGLQLTYTTGWFSRVEVYDFATRSFVPVPPASGARTSVPLGPDEVRDGMVRVRVAEPRVGWGENLWVDASAG